jgi:putative ABC transport system permease protein
MRNLLRRIWYIASGRRHELDLADELAFHREMKAQELRDRGMSEADIAVATRKAMGNELAERQRSRDVWVWPWLQDITQDVRFGARMLAKDRRFTAAAVLALGLGIALTNSVFTIVNTAMFKEVPFAEPARLVDLRLEDSRGLGGQVSPPDYREWRDTAKSFEGLAGHASGSMNLSDEGLSAERLRGSYVSSNLLRLLRTAPIAGRDFLPEDERPGAESVTLVSYETWQSRYGGEPVVGRAVRVNGTPSTIIGVTPPGFAFPFMTQLWQPLSAAPGFGELRRDRRMISVVGRLAEGTDLPAARAEMQTVAATIAGAHPESHKDLRLNVMSLSDSVIYTRRDGTILSTLMGAVAIVLLIACANVASLLLARSTHRAREIAVRAALGATRWRVIRQLLVECALIAAMASAVGAWLSIFGAREISQAFGVYEVGAPGGAVMPYWVDLSFNSLAWMFLGAVALFASLAAGLVPAWHLSRTSVNDTLKDGGRSGSATFRARRMTSGLLVAQLALTVMLLSAAAMLTRSFFDLYFKDLVIDTTGMVTARVTLPPAKYATREAQQQFFDRLDERLTAAPVLASATLASDPLLMPLGFTLSSLEIEGNDAARDAERPQAFATTVGPRYFDTLGLALTRGRALAPADGLPAQEGAVVNERFAAKFFPGGDALGRRIRATTPATVNNAPWFTIVGISRTMPTFIRAVDTEAVAYLPMSAEPRPQRTVSIIVRAADAAASPALAVEALRAQVASIDRDLPVFAVQTLDDAAAMGRRSSRMIGSWFVTVAIIALVLAVVGLYALTAHSVGQRTHEIGVRMALGAQAVQVMWLFVRRTVVQLTLGLSLGLAGSFLMSGVPFIRDANPKDPTTLALVCALLVVVALTASVWPARKATRIDPATALRAD